MSKRKQPLDSQPPDPALYIKSPPRPVVEDDDLNAILNQIYDASATIGKTLADAARYERLTGDKIKGRDHIKKTQQVLNRVQKWLKKPTNRDSTDRGNAIMVYNDLADALEMVDWQEV